MFLYEARKTAPIKKGKQWTNLDYSESWNTQSLLIVKCFCRMLDKKEINAAGGKIQRMQLRGLAECAKLKKDSGETKARRVCRCHVIFL